MLFSSAVNSGAQEVLNNPDYFLQNKGGLKVVKLWISPSEYMGAVALQQSDHQPSEEKISSILEGVKDGAIFETPYLFYGPRDPGDEYAFRQEGFNRAWAAEELEVEHIPVWVRYREDDFQIPHFIMDTIKQQGENMGETLMERVVAKAKEIIGGDSVKIHWDYRDELSKEQKARIVDAAFPSGADFESKGPLASNEEFFKARMDAALDAIDEELRECGGCYDSQHDALFEVAKQISAMPEFSTLDVDAISYELNSHFGIDFNLPQLIHNSDELVRINMMLCDAMGESLSVYRENDLHVCRYELQKILDIFEINPRDWAKMIGDDKNFDYPDISERNNPVVEPKDFVAAVRDLSGDFGHVVIGASMRLSDLIEGALSGTLPWIVDENNMSKTLTLPAGAEVMLHNYASGSGSIGEMQLKRDLKVPVSRCLPTYDGQYGYGIDEIFGLGNDAYWEEGALKNNQVLRPSEQVERFLGEDRAKTVSQTLNLEG